MEKNSIMHLSTSCISVETAGLINESAFHDTKLSDEIVIYMKGVYGWFIPLPENIDKLDIPEYLKNCMLYAEKNDCKWLAFDRDVEYDASDGLKEYTW